MQSGSSYWANLPTGFPELYVLIRASLDIPVEGNRGFSTACGNHLRHAHPGCNAGSL